jgi:cysteinyl-tRNA synthetase
MVRETLGDQIDIHGGGADLIFPHHENEIAQSESLTGKVPFARHWTHTGLVVLGGGEKMAHSAENFTTLASILDQYAPVEVRFWLIGTHYRSSLTFSVDAENGSAARVTGIEDARNALARLRRALGPEPLELQGPLDDTALAAFQAAMDADFNTPDALAVIFDLAREINTRRALHEDVDGRRRTLVHLLDVLGIDLSAAEPREAASIEPFVALTLDLRKKLRDIKQWALADEIRDRLKDLGVIVEDKPGGESTWRIER